MREQIERGESRRRKEELEQSNRAEEALQLLKMRREIGALAEDVQRVAYSEVCALKMRPCSTFQYASSRHFDTPVPHAPRHLFAESVDTMHGREEWAKVLAQHREQPINHMVRKGLRFRACKIYGGRDASRHCRAISGMHDACTTEQDEILLSKQVLSIGYSHQVTPHSRMRNICRGGKT